MIPIYKVVECSKNYDFNNLLKIVSTSSRLVLGAKYCFKSGKLIDKIIRVWQLKSAFPLIWNILQIIAKIDEKVLTANWIWTSAICQSEQQIKVVIRQFPRWCSVLSCTVIVLSTLNSYSLTIKNRDKRWLPKVSLPRLMTLLLGFAL